MKIITQIYYFQKEQGRLAFAKSLGWAPFDEDKNMQQSICLDFLYDSMNFAIEKGFPWNKVAFVVAFADKLIDQIKGKNF